MSEVAVAKPRMRVKLHNSESVMKNLRVLVEGWFHLGGVGAAEDFG